MAPGLYVILRDGAWVRFVVARTLGEVVTVAAGIARQGGKVSIRRRRDAYRHEIESMMNP